MTTTVTRKGWRACALASLAVATGPTGCRPQGVAPPPLGEAVLVVDTDLPVPAMAGRLRVDLFTSDGTWYAARDLALPHTSDWPASFAVALTDGEPAKDVVVRLRVYPEAGWQDYRGMLRLTVDGGVDVTPTTEPLPGPAVDRLVALHLQPGVAGTASVLLAGACAGTMADLNDFTNLATCVDTEATRIGVPATALSPGPAVSTPSAQGTFARAAAAACTTPARQASTWNGTPLHDDDLCVPGGPFVLGGRDGATGDPTDGLPERVAVLPSFLLDRYEVTVGRLRKALAGGLTIATPAVNDRPLGDRSVAPNQPEMCTWSTTPLGREEYPVSCISQPAARAFCQSAGGDLPTEAQWEYAAAVAGRDHKTHYPWGDGSPLSPSCADVVYGRVQASPVGNPSVCALYGPSAVTYAEHPGGDVTPGPGLGLVDLGGNVAEWMLDTFAAYDSSCWLAAPQRSPTCTAAPSPMGMPDVPAGALTTRGGAWLAEPDNLFAVARGAIVPGLLTSVGFRCARPGGT
jgi:sulfatase modifying factor 1